MTTDLAEKVKSEDQETRQRIIDHLAKNIQYSDDYLFELRIAENRIQEYNQGKISKSELLSFYKIEQ